MASKGTKKAGAAEGPGSTTNVTTQSQNSQMSVTLGQNRAQTN